MNKRINRYGFSKHPLYNIYKTMLRRCYDENFPRYKTYGNRGISVCSEV